MMRSLFLQILVLLAGLAPSVAAGAKEEARQHPMVDEEATAALVGLVGNVCAITDMGVAFVGDGIAVSYSTEDGTKCAEVDSHLATVAKGYGVSKISDGVQDVQPLDVIKADHAGHRELCSDCPYHPNPQNQCELDVCVWCCNGWGYYCNWQC